MGPLKRKFRSLYYPNREVAIDEMMVPFKGRHGLRVRIRGSHTHLALRFMHFLTRGLGIFGSSLVLAISESLSAISTTLCFTAIQASRLRMG